MDTVKKMWAAYCEAAGGVTYDGKPLPAWEELGDDRQKCWMAAGKEAADEIERLRQQNAELMEEINKLKQAKEINKYDTHYPDDGFGGYPSVYNRR